MKAIFCLTFRKSGAHGGMKLAGENRRKITTLIEGLLNPSKKAHHAASTTCVHLWWKLTSLENKCPSVKVCVLGQVSILRSCIVLQLHLAELERYYFNKKTYL
jgi:hypothetical protein